MQSVRDFLAAILNREIQSNEEIRLSSAQIARVLMWAEKNSIYIDLAQIRKKFTVSSLTLEPAESSNKNAQRSVFTVHAMPGSMRLGNDIQLVEELFPNAEPFESKSLGKLFTQYEIMYAESTENPKVTLAGLFSLKESLVKAGAEYDTYLDLEICHDSEGGPVVYGFLVSISHSGEYAASVALKLP